MPILNHDATYSISYTDQTTGCTNAAGSAQVTMAVLGTVAPSGVTALASTNSVCSGVSLNLTTDYTGLPDGLTYQWQVSTDNGANWSDITGATALTYSTSITVASVLLQLATAPRMVFDTPRLGSGCFTEVEITFMILP